MERVYDETFLRNRITALRLKKGDSEYRMSTYMGKSKGYIQGITSGRSLPSLTEFLYMCEYFGITPRQFFDDEDENPALINEATSLMRDMDEDDLKALIGLLRRFPAKRK